MSNAASGDNSNRPPPDPLTQEAHNGLLNEMLVRHTNQLAEHFTSVQIIATNLESDGATNRFAEGSGDYYARYGATKQWVADQERKAE